MQTVVLYGNSLVVSTFGSSLEGYAGLRLLRVDASQPGADEQLSALRPDIVIFDLKAGDADFAIRLWKILPDLLLIGVTPDSSELLVLSSRRQRAWSVEDLLAIMREEGKKTNEKGEDFGKHERKASTTKLMI